MTAAVPTTFIEVGFEISTILTLCPLLFATYAYRPTISTSIGLAPTAMNETNLGDVGSVTSITSSSLSPYAAMYAYLPETATSVIPEPPSVNDPTTENVELAVRLCLIDPVIERFVVVTDPNVDDAEFNQPIVAALP